MKKKIHEEEGSLQNNESKTTDNKEYINNSETNKTKDSDESEVFQSSEVQEGDADIEVAADKVGLQVRAVEEKLAEMQDKYLRLSAEFDNYRKRTLREKMELSKYAEENLLFRIIQLMDDFERALQHIESSPDDDAVRNGINLIYTKFSEFLKQYNIKEIDAIDSSFNVDLHEAVAKVQVEEIEKKGKVVDVVLKGYFLQDKVLRFAKVVVGE